MDFSEGLTLFFFFCFLGLYLRHMELPRLGVQLELQLPAYSTATAMQDLSRICNLQHSSWQHRILNPLREVTDRNPQPHTYESDSFPLRYDEANSRTNTLERMEVVVSA